MQAVRELPRRHPAAAATDDRRRSPREALSAKGLISTDCFDEESEGQIVEVFDLNLQGIGFRCPVPMETGCYHQILVMAGPLRLSSRLRVVSNRADAQGGFEVGAEFC